MEALGDQSVRLSRRLLAGCLLLLVLASPAFADKGKKWFEQGRKAENRNDLQAALQDYEKAASLSPENAEYRTNLYRVRFQVGMWLVTKGQALRIDGKLDDALKAFEEAYKTDPSNSMAAEEIRRTAAMIEAAKAGVVPGPALTPREEAQAEVRKRLSEISGPITLTPPSREGITLNATNDSKVLFETIGRLAGINVLFDANYPPGKRVTLNLNNVTLEQALDELAVLTKSLWKPLTSNTILVYDETRRRDLEPLVVKTFYLSNVLTPTDIQEVAQVFRNLLEITKVQTVNSQNAIVVAASPDKMSIVEKIVNDLDKAKPEVVIDVAVMAVTRDFSREIGLFPGSPGLQIPVTFTPGGAVVTPPSTGGGTTPAGTIPLSRLNRLSTNDWSITLPGAALNLLYSDSRTKLLQNPQVRASDGQPAKLRIGERQPVATGSFQPGIGGVGINPLVNTQFQYLDVGVNVDITPRVHAENEVTLKVMVEISAVTSFVNIGGISQPVIGQRRIEEEIRLKEGEINILGGILENQLTDSISGIPGVSQVPILKYLFSDFKKSISESEVLIVMTPHVVRVPAVNALNLRTIDVGTATNMQVKTRQEVVAPPLPAGTSRVAPAGPGAGVPPAGTLPGGVPPVVPPITPGVGVPGVPPGAPPPNAPLVAPPAGPGAAQPTGTPPMPPATAPAPATAAPGAPTAPVAPTPPATQGQPTQPAAGAEEEGAKRPQVTTLRLNSGTYEQSMNDRFNVQVSIDNVNALQSVPLQLQYDPKEIKLVDVINGDLLGRDGQAVAIVQQTNDQAGTSTVVLNRPPGSAGISGSGTLATLQFQAIGRGDAVLRILQTAGRDPGGQPLQMRGTQARVIVK